MTVTRAQFRRSLLHRVKEQQTVTRPGTTEWEFLADLEYLLVKEEPYVEWAKTWRDLLDEPRLLDWMEEDADRRIRTVHTLLQCFRDMKMSVKPLKNTADTSENVSQDETSTQDVWEKVEEEKETD